MTRYPPRSGNMFNNIRRWIIKEQEVVTPCAELRFSLYQSMYRFYRVDCVNHLADIRRVAEVCRQVSPLATPWLEDYRILLAPFRLQLIQRRFCRFFWHRTIPASGLPWTFCGVLTPHIYPVPQTAGMHSLMINKPSRERHDHADSAPADRIILNLPPLSSCTCLNLFGTIHRSILQTGLAISHEVGLVR